MVRFSFVTKVPLKRTKDGILTSGFEPTAPPSPADKAEWSRGFVSSYSSDTVADFHGIPAPARLGFFTIPIERPFLNQTGWGNQAHYQRDRHVRA
jgi:hypothetical protein